MRVTVSKHHFAARSIGAFGTRVRGSSACGGRPSPNSPACHLVQIGRQVGREQLRREHRVPGEVWDAPAPVTQHGRRDFRIVPDQRASVQVESLNHLGEGELVRAEPSNLLVAVGDRDVRGLARAGQPDAHDLPVHRVAFVRQEVDCDRPVRGQSPGQTVETLPSADDDRGAGCRIWCRGRRRTDRFVTTLGRSRPRSG